MVDSHKKRHRPKLEVLYCLLKPRFYSTSTLSIVRHFVKWNERNAYIFGFYEIRMPNFCSLDFSNPVKLSSHVKFNG